MTNTSHWQIIRPVRHQIYTAMSLSVVSAAASVGFLLLLCQTLIALNEQQAWHIYAIAAFFCSFITLFSRRYAFNLSHYASFQLERILRLQLSQNIANSSLGVIQTLGSGTVAKILQEDVRNLHIFVADSIPLYARVYAMPLFIFIALFYLNPFFACWLLGFAISGFMVLNWALKRTHRPELHQQYHQSQEQVSNKIIEFMQIMPAIRAFGEYEYTEQQYRQLLNKQSDFLKKWYKNTGVSAKSAMLWLNPLSSLLLILWLGVLFFPSPLFTLLEWQTVLLLGTGMVEALMPYISLFHLIDKAKLSIARIQSLRCVAQLPQAAQPTNPKHYDIEFHSVDFIYPQQREHALSNLSFRLPQGSFTLIVGESGSGKTTLLQLLLRFWDTTKGSIQIGGVDIRHIQSSDLMSLISVVQQENRLFSGTIRESLCLGLEQLSDEKIIEVAQTAQIHHFIQTLPKGYDSFINECGNNFSRGQIQRLAIARAILQNRPILLLDEPTAYFDYATEHQFMQMIEQLSQHKTVLMIAHRLDYAPKANRILYLEKGRLLEQGSHQELLSRQNRYASLWQAYNQARHWHY